MQNSLQGVGTERSCRPQVSGICGGTPVMYCSWHLPRARLAFQFHIVAGAHPVQGPIHVMKSGCLREQALEL